ncbi:MAG: hypothetical protein M3Z04_16570 [Chloroflexota bacterium]|nr:hypothetical protein [Chloroflexota bacterium]
MDLLPSYKANVLRVESDHAQMLYHDFSHNPGRVGVVSWHRRSTAEDDEITVEQSWSAPVSGEIPALAFAAGYMFILQEYEVHALNSRGEVELIYPVPEGCQYVGFDTIPAHGSNPVALILVCSSLANGGMATASVYTL